MTRRRPTKAFETDGALDFEFYLADRLKLTVAQLRQQMSADEFMRWGVWHGRRAQVQQLAARKGA